MPANNTNISSYTAADLMRYAAGKMSPAEMYALEKAAMEDSFFAEALEGYMEAVASQPKQMLNEQVKRINKTEEKEKNKVVPIWRRKIIQLAVAACFVAGGGWFIFSLLQKPTVTNNEIAAVPNNSSQTQPNNGAAEYRMLATDSSIVQQPAIKDSEYQSPLAVTQNQEIAPKPAAAPGAIALQQTDANKNAATSKVKQTFEQADRVRMDTVVAAAPSTGELSEATVSLYKKEASAMQRKAYLPQHVFRGRITDASNNPLPYSNVMIEGQDFGTYSDAFGNFNFISDDSILPVRVRSVGYLPKSIALRDSKQESKIVMQEDNQLSGMMTVQPGKVAPSQAKSMKSIIERDSLTGAEAVNIPFYNTYLLNNNRISPLPTLNKEVQLSFEVTSTGEPANITVVKSSGKALDEEAIRLVKEGPKLSQGSSNKSKKKVTIRF